MKNPQNDQEPKKQAFLAQIMALAAQYRNMGRVELLIKLASQVSEDTIPDDIPEAARLLVDIAVPKKLPPNWWN